MQASEDQSARGTESEGRVPGEQLLVAKAMCLRLESLSVQVFYIRVSGRATEGKKKSRKECVYHTISK